MLHGFQVPGRDGARLRAAALVLACLALSTPSHAAEPLTLSVPVRCEIGKTCFIQNYVDVDPGKGVRDHACGQATYDGHNGIDFRVKSIHDVKAGVNVVAAAPGRVKGVRDELADTFVRDTGAGPVAGKECGNGLVIDHGEGWETQYCHMRRGSLLVQPGQTVERGQVLGRVGYSGLADFPHLHLSVRHDNVAIDPFLGTAFNGTCRKDVPKTTLWDEAAQRLLAYRTGVIIEAAFTSQAPSWQALEAGTLDYQISGESLVLMFFVRIMNVEAGDVVRLSFKGPGGLASEQTFDAIDKHKAVHVANIGARRSVGGWPKGTYTGKADVLRGGVVISSLEVSQEGPAP